MTTGSQLVLPAAKTLHTVSKFVFGDGLKNAVRLISGDDSMDAAFLALSTNSSYPEQRIVSAINHLESAHISYSKIFNSVKDRHDYASKWYDVMVSIDRDLFVCALITLCHCALKDYPAAKQSIKWGFITIKKEEEIRKINVTPRIFGIPAPELNPKSYLSLPGQIFNIAKAIPNVFSDDNGGISSIHYNEFCESIKIVLP